MPQPATYQNTLQNLILTTQEARYKVLQAVSKKTLNLYWQIGKTVSQKAQEEKWGNGVVEKLAKDLQVEFPGIKGFLARNIWRMKIFYETYEANQKLTLLVAEIGWVQNCMIIEKCKDDLEKEFYLKKTKQMGWSKLDLQRNIKQDLYNNQPLSQNNFENTVSTEIKSRAAWEFVGDYNIELVNPDQLIAEKDLENSMVNNILKFLSEMGGSFAFVGRQFRIEYRDKEYFIDLLFFNLTLNCYVVFELKAREFDPKDLGQLQMYLLATNEVLKKPDQKDTIGILICKEKDRVIVEYLLNSQINPVGLATYNQHQDVPKNIAKYLPSEEEIIKRLIEFN